MFCFLFESLAAFDTQTLVPTWIEHTITWVGHAYSTGLLVGNFTDVKYFYHFIVFITCFGILIWLFWILINFALNLFLATFLGINETAMTVLFRVNTVRFHLLFPSLQFLVNFKQKAHGVDAYC